MDGDIGFLGHLKLNSLAMEKRFDLEPERWACGVDVIAVETLENRSLARIV